jgi:outer membrane murein-binding lipoprotein Lpp
MNPAHHSLLKPTLLLGLLLGSMTLAGCSSSAEKASMAPSLQVPVAKPEAAVSRDRPQGLEVSQTSHADASAATQVPRSQPQLVKNAQLVLVVNELEKTVQSVSRVIKIQQGDLLALQDQMPPADAPRHTVLIQIRVPQNQLEATLNELAKLGTLQRRSLSTEDVSNQLVDYQARLRNLHKSEATILKIMDRSGSISDVLKVSQELSNTRALIEQLSAQLSSLQNQVSYARISLTLEEAIAATPPQRSLSLRIQETWEQATNSLSQQTANLLFLAIWLLVYSPYLLLFSGTAAYGHFRFRQHRARSLPPEPGSPRVS